MGEDEQGPPEDDFDDSLDEDDARIDVGSLVMGELASIKGMGADKAVDRGPRPRALSRARIQVKSDGTAPRVRSGKLTPLRHSRTGPSALVKINTPDLVQRAPSPRPPQDHPSTEPLLEDLSHAEDAPWAAPDTEKRRLLIPLQVVAILLLLETALLPSVRAKVLVTPWAAWTDPASPNFVALVFMALFGAFFAFPVTRLLRTALHGLVAAILTIFALVLLRSSLASGAFDGQPALHALFVEGLSGGFFVVIAVGTLLTSLLWLHSVPQSTRARITATVGVGMVCFVYLGLGVLTELSATPMTILLDAAEGAAFAGDRLAATMSWPLLLSALIALAVWSPRFREHGAGPLGILVWALTMLPMLVLALYVAPFERWHEAMVPLQITSLLAAGLLLLASCLGHTLALRELGERED